MDDVEHIAEAVPSRESCFASAVRADRAALLSSIDLISRNPVIDTLLTSVGGLLAVLNEHRQIVAVNDVFLAALGVKDTAELFGLRPGEAVQCVHAHDIPGGCGTGRFCSTCGAAVAIVTSLCVDKPVERDCAIVVERRGKRENLFFRVRAHAISINGSRFVLLFLQDMTEHQRRATLERLFLHDFGNLLGGLLGNIQLLSTRDGGRSEAAERILQLAMRLAREIEVHRAILGTDPSEISVTPENVSALEVAHDIDQVFAQHPAANARHLLVGCGGPDGKIWTDRSLLLRVLANAVTNALEASAEGDSVRFWHETTETGVTFHVWNNGTIPENIALRIFQMAFTTKKGTGRGIGTYVMKLLTEEYLGGTVSFTSSPEHGTVFRICLPYEFPGSG